MDKVVKKLNIAKALQSLLKWAGMAVAVGCACGVIGALFFFSVNLVTEARSRHGWLIYLLPLGALLTVFIYRLSRVTKTGADSAVAGLRTGQRVSFMLAPVEFICSVITHLLGGSAGREGAALKIGGSVSAWFSALFRLDKDEQNTLTLAGMSGLFAAVFGTPLAAAVFTLEAARVKGVKPWSIVVSLCSSFVAFATALICGVTPERFAIAELPQISLDSLWRVAVLAAVGGVVGWVFCFATRSTANLAKRLMKNDYLRAAVCSAMVVGLTALVGASDYNGGGLHVIEGIFHGRTVGYEAFLIKIVFTAFTVAAGLKGGQVIPALFVGAAFGASGAALLNLPAPFGAAIGMTALFCGATNCPMATLLISAEMFGVEGLPYFAIAVVLSFICSGEPSLYGGKKLPLGH